MQPYLLPACYALLVWWLSTGLIIWLDNLPARTFRWSMAGYTALLLLALQQLAAGAQDASLAGAYAAFTWGVIAWGWQEMSFFMGFVTGPRRVAEAAACGPWRHFLHGVQACLYHELAILLTASLVLAATWGAPNQVGAWTFLAIWGARQSAKLNVFLGVRNLNLEFLPDHLAYLRSFLRCRPMNLLFPVSVSLGTVLVLVLARHAAAATDPARAAGLTFVTSMLALAVTEHWLMVLPLPFARLWAWFIRRRAAAAHATTIGATTADTGAANAAQAPGPAPDAPAAAGGAPAAWTARNWPTRSWRTRRAAPLPT